MSRTIRDAALAAVVGLCAIVPAARADISYTDLYTLGTPAGMTSATPGGSNGVQMTAGGQVTGWGIANGQFHAVVWSASNPSGTDLNPGSGFNTSFAKGTDGSQQVGYGTGSATGGLNHALLWTATGPVDLNPVSGISDSFAFGIGGTQQVGYGYGTSTSNENHALVWSGAAHNVADLHPGSGFSSSTAYGTDGSHQVGWGSGTATSGNSHALLWSGSAAGYVDLNLNSGFDATRAYAVSGAQKVGDGRNASTSGNYHAVLWTGNGDSAVDLNPNGYGSSAAYGTDGAMQVGYGNYGLTGADHALLWSGTAGSFIDLGALLPNTFTKSYAYSISNNIVYGYAADTSGSYHAITWAIPEPSAMALLAGAGLMMMRRRGARG